MICVRVVAVNTGWYSVHVTVSISLEQIVLAGCCIDLFERFEENTLN